MRVSGSVDRDLRLSRIKKTTAKDTDYDYGDLVARRIYDDYDE